MWIDPMLLALMVIGQCVALLILLAWVGEIHERVRRLDEAAQLAEVRDAEARDHPESRSRDHDEAGDAGGGHADLSA